MTEEIDPLSVKRTFEQAFNSTTFETIQTTTFSKGTGSQATRQEVIGRDGSLLRIVGTATQPVRFEYGVEQESGVWRRFTKEIKLDAAHQDTPEWKKTYVDMAGRAYKTVYAPDGTAHEQTWYDTSGRTSGRLHLDGVVTLYQYNSLGELEYSTIDLNTNGVIDLGSDRVTRTVSDVIASGAYATNVRRQRTYEYRTTGNSTGSSTKGQVSNKKPRSHISVDRGAQPGGGRQLVQWRPRCVSNAGGASGALSACPGTRRL